MATSVVSQLLSGGIQGAGQGIAAVIDAIRGKSPEDAAKLAQIAADVQELQTKYQGEFALAKINENVSLNQTASANIQAESKSTGYAANARPSVIYGGLFIALINYAILALIPQHYGFKPIDVPSTFWDIWCVCVTGYVFARTADKVFGGQGGSASLPFGIKIDSKGD